MYIASHREKASKTAFLWLLLAITITVPCGLVHLAVQQDLRQGANDPQIQMAEDGARALAAGASVDSVIPVNAAVDIASSLAPYIIIYNDAGDAIAGSGKLNDVLPTLPRGVLDYAKAQGEDRITWQPEPYVRQATVIIRYSGAQHSGFILAGRSLREVEIREGQLELEVGAAWIFGLLATLIASAVYAYRKELTGRISGSQ